MRKSTEVIMPLYRLATSNASTEQILDWVSRTTTKLSTAAVKRTLKSAGREDLLEYLIQEEDVTINDKVKSRQTARVGKIIGIHTDGDTVDVKWNSGGVQALSKESLFKIKNEDDPNTISKYSTGADTDPYDSMKKHDIYIRENDDPIHKRD